MPKMIRMLLMLPLLWMVYTFIGCSKVQFNADATQANTACSGSAQSCVVTSDGAQNFDYTVTTGPNQADILFVVDNTASMSSVQNQIASRFPGFIQSLGSIDYHIGVTTMDISNTTNTPSPPNGNGALQDGKLIPFTSGVSVLTSAVPNAASLFGSTIQRPETVTCESYLATHYLCAPQGSCPDYHNYCPSQDTRGIYAANLAVQRNESGFLRNNVNLSIVLISNSDERASGGIYGALDQLETNDMPATLVAQVSQEFQDTKALSAHAIIIVPGDSACLAAQHFSQYIFGFYGQQYANLANLTNGVTGSICSTNYTSELGQIATNIANQSSSIDLPCQPVNNLVTITLTPADPSISYQLVGPSYTKVQFSGPVPGNTQERIQFTCPAPSES